MRNKTTDRLMKLIEDLNVMSIIMTIIAFLITWYALSSIPDKNHEEQVEMKGWEKPSMGDTIAKEIPAPPLELPER